MKKMLIAAAALVCAWAANAQANSESTTEVQGAPYYDDVITCESWQYKYNTCYVGEDVDRVELVRELSKTDCNRGSTWGYRDGYIWVDRGCRAEFGIERYQYRQRVSCGSNGYKFNRCSFGRPIRDARLVYQQSRSACDYGRSWGFDRDSIWVDNGCRGDFDVVFGR